MEADRKAWLEERQQGIGASDAAGVLGLSPWATPLSVYHSKVDPIEEQEQPTLPMWLGLRLEDVVAELFTARTGLQTRGDNQLHRHPAQPWLVAHLDYRVLGRPKELVECKTQFNRAGWGEPGTDEVPVYYWVQAQHEMLVTVAMKVWMPVLFGTYDFAVYEIDRDNEFIDRWEQAADDFWHNHVVARIPPPLSGDEFSRKVVRARWPEHDDVLKVLPPERELLVLRLRDEEAKLKEQEEVTAALRNRVLDLIGDAAGIEGSWGKITWKTTKDRTKVNWELVAAAYKAVIGNLLDTMNPGDDEVAVQALALAENARDAVEPMYTTVEPGYRRIDIRWRKE